MKSIRHIERSVRKQEQFNQDDVANAIFLSEFPIVETRPFVSFRKSVLAKLPVFIALENIQEREDVVTTLKRVMKKVGNREITSKYDFNSIYSWMAQAMVREYIKKLQEWRQYVFATITEFCDSNVQSQMQWGIVKHGGAELIFTLPLTEEQRMWLTVCGRLEERKKIELIEGVLEQLHPWLNYDLWKAQKKNVEDTHINVDYEKHRREMLEGSFSEESLDIIK